MSDNYRIERDTMGEMRVPVERPVRPANAARGRELPDQLAAIAARIHPRPGIDQGLRRRV